MKNIKGYRVGEEIPNKAKFLYVKKQEIMTERRVKFSYVVRTFELIFYYEIPK